MTKLWTRRAQKEDERGAILIMATVGIVLAIIAAALAIDLGRIAQERRSDQRVADLAALDAARDLGNTDALAQASADRNKFPWSKPGYSLTTAVGSLDANRVFHAGVGSGAVEVTVKSPISNTFISGSRTITTRAVATVENQGAFSIGSSLAGLDASKTVLNQFVGRWIQASGPVNVLSYNGLATSNVTLGALQQQLLASGLDVGTVDKLLNTSLTMPQLLKATANALGPSSPTAAADLNGLALAAGTGGTVKLGDLIDVAQGSGDAALSGSVNVFRLVTGSAAVANGTNTVSLPALTVNIPGLSNIAVGLTVTDLPKMYIGPTTGARPHAQTAQVKLTVTPTIDVNAAIAHVTGALPITVNAAKAIGNLTAVTCGAGSGITVEATTGAASETAGTTLGVSLLGGAPLQILNVALTSNAGSTGPTPLTFSYPTGFGAPGQHVGTTTAGLGSLLTADTNNALLNGVLNTVLGTLRPVLDAVDSQVVRPILQAAGADIGTADVIALPIQPNGVKCDNVTLAV